MKRSNNSLYISRQNGDPMRKAADNSGVPLTLDRAPNGAFVVHAITPDGIVSLGAHEHVADAWAAIDAFESLHYPPAQFARAA